MKAIIEIERLFNERVEFLESLLIISSYQGIVQTNPQKLKEENARITQVESNCFMQILRTTRVEDSFKRFAIESYR